MSVDDVQSWVANHQVLTAILLVVLLIGSIFILSLGSTINSGGLRSQSIQQEASSDLIRSLSSSGGSADSHKRAQTESQGGEYVEIKEGRMEIKTENAQRDANQIRGMLSAYQGYVEESRKYGSDLYTNVKLQVRVPSTGNNFERLLKRLRQNYNVKSYNVKNYRLSTQRELDELTILNKTITDYEQIRQKANSMVIGEDKLDMLMQITERELDIIRKKKNYERELSGKQRRSDYATLNVELQEKKSVSIGPENIGNRFKHEVKDMLDNIVNILIETVTFGVELFFRVIQLIVYVIIILIPLALVYRLGKAIYKRYW